VKPAHLVAAMWCALVLAPSRATAQDASAPDEVELTVGADGTSVVREVRSAQVAAGDVRLRLFDVSPRLEPQTLTVRALAEPELLEVAQQTTWFEILDFPRALERTGGRPVQLLRWHDTELEKLEGHLLFPPVVPGPDGDVRLPLYLEQSDGSIRFLDGAELQLASLPPGDWNRTRVDLRLRCKRADRYRFETLYATRGLAWRADLTLRVAADGAHADLSALATIDNQTGVAWRNARLSVAEADGPLPWSRRLQDGERASALLHPLAEGVTVEAHTAPQFTLAQARDVAVKSTPTLVVQRDANAAARATVVRRFDLVDAAARGVTRALPGGTARVVTLDARSRPMLVSTRPFAPLGAGEPLHFLADTVAGVVASSEVAPRGDGTNTLRVRVRVASEREDRLDVDVLFPLRVGERVTGSHATDALFAPSIARVVVSVAPRQTATAEFDVALP
jgi:hypothetical protein